MFFLVSWASPFVIDSPRTMLPVGEEGPEASLPPPSWKDQGGKRDPFSSHFCLYLQFNDVLLYTSRGLTASNQFKVHGQLPLYGMTVSVQCGRAPSVKSTFLGVH